MLPTPTSKLQFVIVRDIAADVGTVFDVLTSEAGMRRWIPLCRSVEWRHPAGSALPGAGSVRHIVIAGGVVAAERIVAWEGGRGLQYTFDESSLPLGKLTSGYVGVSSVEALAADRSRLTWSVYFDTPGWRQLLSPVLRFNLRAFIGLMASKVRSTAEARSR